MTIWNPSDTKDSSSFGYKSLTYLYVAPMLQAISCKKLKYIFASCQNQSCFHIGLEEAIPISHAEEFMLFLMKIKIRIVATPADRICCKLWEKSKKLFPPYLAVVLGGF